MNNQNYLDQIDTRIKDVQMYHSDNLVEIVRLCRARLDVVSKMSEEDLAEYNASLNYVQSEADKKKEFDEIMMSMNSNVDRPSI